MKDAYLSNYKYAYGIIIYNFQNLRKLRDKEIDKFQQIS